MMNKQYKDSVFMAKGNYYLKQFHSLEKAVKTAVKYCQKHDILREFLEVHATEVLNMLLTEWNTEDAKKVWYEDGLEEGIEKGKNYVMELLEQGLSIDEIKLRLTQEIKMRL